jgi:hypothetical protein
MINKKESPFGWFDVIDDIEVTALFRIYELGKKNGLECVGPNGVL